MDSSFVWWISCSGHLPHELRDVGAVSLVGEAMGRQVWQLWALPQRMNEFLPRLLRVGTVHGAALVEVGHSVKDLWWTTEWRGCLVVSRRLTGTLWTRADILEGPWEADRRELSTWDDGFRSGEGDDARPYLVLRPRPEDRAPSGSKVELVTAAGAYRARLMSALPTAIDVHVGEVIEQSHLWFGDLVGGPVGGGMALLSLSGPPGIEGRIRLRNAAALGLVAAASPEAVSGHVRSGLIVCRAWGASAGDQPPSEWPQGDAPVHMAADGRASYRVYLLLQAVVDPEVEIEAGTIFEQMSHNGVQTLATAAAHRLTVHPGYTAPVMLDAWCLNAGLSAPHGQDVRVTGLRLGTVDDSQSAVWQERAKWVGQP